MLPFLVLAIPAVMLAITNAQPTGYDRSGALGALLTAAEIQAKRDFEESLRRQALDPKARQKDATLSAWLDSCKEAREKSRDRVRGMIGLLQKSASDTDLEMAPVTAAPRSTSASPPVMTVARSDTPSLAPGPTSSWGGDGRGAPLV